MYIFGVLSIIWGTFGLLGVLSGSGFLPFVFQTAINLGFGYLAWRAAADLHLPSAKLYYFYRVFLAVLSTLVFLWALVFLFLPSLNDQIDHDMDEAIKQEEEANPDGHHLTPQQTKRLDDFIIVCLVLSFPGCLLSLYLCFVVWSFKERVSRGEVLVVTTGLHPVSAHLAGYTVGGVPTAPPMADSVRVVHNVSVAGGDPARQPLRSNDYLPAADGPVAPESQPLVQQTPREDNQQP
ncbi:unnamed protein product [Vitrella brassicaformis CCMP3155]|uniref:Uncharacterized protein n=1 Tax=Vitrella brassicaformis (strain CCMP3155) TaxID=1169540 RepID=A0A0G4EX45_VITBC|nr:unnamed protein product [Vitrella brassicaformis CCMP3155]|eukprot:CEM03363.1 unnamed protein product [Vitrella brassicaformis CCMP3155]